MAIFSIIERSQFGEGCILSPERYDPRRAVLSGLKASVPLGSLVSLHKKTISPKAKDLPPGEFLVLDASNAREGMVVVRRDSVSQAEIGSVKKTLFPGCVIISRLRPYLRQVAFADNGIPGLQESTSLACSTEFFVLGPLDGQSIAFLVPFLLSETVQKVLAASQEGGHHPRFDAQTLLGLSVPQKLLERREQASLACEGAISEYRQVRTILAELILAAESQIVQVN